MADCSPRLLKSSGPIYIRCYYYLLNLELMALDDGKGTHAYEVGTGVEFEAPTFDQPRSYTFKPGMTLPISTMGKDLPNGLYCELQFPAGGDCVVVSYEGQNIVVPQGNQAVEVGPNLLVKYDHPRVKLVPMITSGMFRAGMSLPMTLDQMRMAKEAVNASKGPAFTMVIEEEEEEEERPALPRNPTLVADAPEVLRTYHDNGDKWVAPLDFADEFMILDGDHVLFQARVSLKPDGSRELLRPGKEPVALGGPTTMFRVKDESEEGEPVKAMVFIENGTVTVQPLTAHPLQVGSRDQVYKERLAAMDSKDPVSMSSTSTIYPEETGFTTPVSLDDHERVIRMIPLGHWEAGASVVLLARDGFVSLQNRSTSNPEIKVVRVAPNGPAVSIEGHARVQLFDDRGNLNLAVIAMSADAPMRISDSLGNPRALKRATLADLNELTAAPPNVRSVVPSTAPAMKSALISRDVRPSDAELAERPGCLPAPIAALIQGAKKRLDRALAWINEDSPNDFED